MRKIIFYLPVLLFFSCNKPSEESCPVSKEKLLGNYCFLPVSSYYASYEIKEFNNDTLVLTDFQTNLKFVIDGSYLIFPKQEVRIPVDWDDEGPVEYADYTYGGYGEMNCDTEQLDVFLTKISSKGTENIELNLNDVSSLDFYGTYISHENDRPVKLKLSNDPLSDSLVIAVEMNFTDARDSILRNIKARNSGCYYEILIPNTDTSNLRGFFHFKKNEVLFQFKECYNSMQYGNCSDENGITLNYLVHCCDDILIFEGEKTD